MGDFTISGYEDSIVEITFQGENIKIKAKSIGITNAIISSGSYSQEITIIVRKIAGNGNGWL